MLIPENPGLEFVALLSSFLLPLFEDLRSGARREGIWPPRGP